MNLPIGTKIKLLRKKNRLRQYDLCNEIIDRTVLSKIENNRIIPSIKQLQYIANKLDVPLEYFFEEDEKIKGNLTHDHDIVEMSSDSSIVENLFLNRSYYKIIDLYENNKLNPAKDINNFYYVGLSYYHCEYFTYSLKIIRKYVQFYLKCDENFKRKYIENYATSLNTLSNIVLRNSNYEKSIAYLREAKIKIEEYNFIDKRIYYLIVSNIGAIYCKSNQYKKVIDLLENFLDKVQDHCFIKLLPNIHLSLNIAYYNLNNYIKSIDHIKKAIFLYEYSGRFLDAAQCYLNYINALRYNKQFEKAFTILKEFKLSNLYNKYYNELFYDFLVQEMVLYFNVRNYDMFLKLRVKLKLNELNEFNRKGFYFMMGHIYFQKNDYQKCISYFNKCLNYLIENNFSYDLVTLYQDLYTIRQTDDYYQKYLYYKGVKGKKNIMVPK